MLVSFATSFSQNIRIELKDKAFSSPIAFSMMINEEKTKGGTTDINGHLQISSKPGECWYINAFGYKKTKACWKGDNPWIILLESSDLDLPELVIHVKEDPAYRVVRSCILNAKKNDPAQSKSFQYEQYSKLIIDFVKGNNAKLDSLFTDKHLMLMETVSQRKHAPPGYDHEEIIANQMSGFQVPQSAIIGTQMQSFSIYEPDFQIFENVYLSPAGPRAIDRYEYKMLDTLYDHNDSIFVISFFPKKRFIDNGMKGQFHIHSSNYSVCRLIAEPSAKDPSLYVKIQQFFSSLNGTFFPFEINAFFELPQLQNPISGEIQTQIKNLSIEKYTFRDFDNVSLTLEDAANQKDSAQWQSLRYEPLSDQDINTYVFLDSLSRAANLEKKTQFLTSLSQGIIQWGSVQIPIQRLFRYNAYEGYRTGLGINLHPKGLKPLTCETYFAYGNKDKAMKWGAGIHWAIEPDKSGWRIQYFSDVRESGQQLFPIYRPQINQSVYELFATRMDKIQGVNASVYFPIYQSLAGDLSYQFQSKQPFTLNALYADEQGIREINKYQLEEYKALIRWAPGERRVKVLDRQYLLNGFWPIFKFGWTQSYWREANMSSSLPFSRYQLECEKTFKTVYYGDLKIFAECGQLIGNAPLTETHAAKGTISPARKISISVPQTFETLPNGQWYARTYAHLFVRYKSNFSLYKTESSEPRITVLANAGWGKLDEQYHNQDVHDYSKGLYEIGFQLDNILKSATGGLGMGTYYRMGPYYDHIEKNNWMIKLTSSLLF